VKHKPQAAWPERWAGRSIIKSNWEPFMRHRFLLASLILFASALARADDQAVLPADLAAVPGSAIGFVHVRVADIWKGDMLKEVRNIVQKAGPSALKALDDRFFLAPSALDRVTAILLNPQGSPEPPVVIVIATSQAFDRAKVVKGVLPEAVEVKEGDKVYHADEKSGLAVHVIDDKTLVVSPVVTMQSFLALKLGDKNQFAEALAEAARKPIYAAISTSLLPGEAIAQLPPPLQPLARAKMLQASIDFGTEVRLDLKLTFPDEARAKAGESSAKDGVKMARQALMQFRKEMEEKLMPQKPGEKSPITELPEAALSLVMLGYLQHADEFLRDLPLKRQGNALATSASLPTGPYTQLLGMSGLSAGLMLPAVQKVREAAGRSKSFNNLKQMTLAMYNYHDLYNGFPSAAICDKNGKPLLSWRVAILPFIEQDALYKEFHLDEPWDSEHNKKLIARMPNIYALPGVTNPGETTTYYRVFYGNGALFNLGKPVRISDISDGTSNTIMIVEAGESVPWTKPDELEFDPSKALPKLGKQNSKGFAASMADGSVRFINAGISAATLKAAITRAGGEVLGSDF
jgi:hypothetical protein